MNAKKERLHAAHLQFVCTCHRLINTFAARRRSKRRQCIYQNYNEQLPFFLSTFSCSACSCQLAIVKHPETRMVDLPYDILRLIMMLVAQSPDGAVTFARAVSSCKMLNEYAADSEILKKLEFENVRIFRIHESFWDENSLLHKCSDAGNERAYNIIWKQDKKEKLKRVMRMKRPFMAREFLESIPIGR